MGQWHEGRCIDQNPTLRKIFPSQTNMILLKNSVSLPAFLSVGAGFLINLSSFTTPAPVFAHAGHSHNDFKSETAQPADAIAVDAETVKRMGIQVEPLQLQHLSTVLKTTGQIEALPNQTVKVTAPTNGTVVELFVKPGDRVSQNQPLAVLSSSELAQLRIDALSKRAEAEADLQQAKADLKLAQENLDRQRQIATAEIAQTRTQLLAAQKQYSRDRELVEQASVVKVAQENYQRQLEIAQAEIAQAETEFAVAQEQYDRDQDLVNSGAIPRRQLLESQAHLAQAKAQLARTQQKQNVLEAEGEIRRAEVDLPLRNLRDSQSQVAQVQAQLTKALSRRDVLEAEAQLKRANAALEVAESRLRLADAAYQARLQQLGMTANDRGLVTIVAPISGTVAEREITLGESVQAVDKPLMSLLNNGRVFATANLYEKDLSQIQEGLDVKVKVAGLSERVFRGKITLIGTAVNDETRVVPVKAELENIEGLLKPGMFADLEIVTGREAVKVLAIPTSALIETKGKQVVYVQNGQAFQPVEVSLGKTLGDLVEIKSGLFEGDLIVTQRANQLYAQSLRRGKTPQDSGDNPAPVKREPLTINAQSLTFPGWWLLPLTGVISVGAFWLGRRTQPRQHSTLRPPKNAPIYDLEAYLTHSEPVACEREDA